VYTLFRYLPDDAEAGRVMLLLNKSREARQISLARYAEMLKPGASARDVIKDQALTLGDSLVLPARSALLLEF